MKARFPSEPISRAFVPDKQGARRHYGSHPYFTKRAWNVVQRYIEHFSPPGALVLDPFGGSGITAVESLVLRRRAAYVDINEWACFLARQAAIAPVNLGRLSEAYLRLESRYRKAITDLWEMSDLSLSRRPVAHWYPKGVPLPDNSDVHLVEELFTPRMLHGLAMLRHGIMETPDIQVRDLLLLAFSSTLVRINRTFLSAGNRSETRGGSAVFSLYRYKVAKNPVELPLWEQFTQRFEKLLQAKRETNLLIGDFYQEGVTADFRHGSATHLSEFIPPESVDYIYTDPPYGAHIPYLDLSVMWMAWLGMGISQGDREQEVIEGGQLRKTAEDYRSLLSQSLKEMSKVLKTGAWLSLVYAHRDTSYWESIVQASRDAGLEYVNTVVQPVGVVWSMHKKKNPLRVLSGELVLNFRKGVKAPRRAKRSVPRDCESVALEVCAKEILSRDGATTEEVHHAIIPVLLENGLLGDFSRRHGDMTPLLEDRLDFDSESGRWHLREDPEWAQYAERRRLARYFLGRMWESSQRSAQGLSLHDACARLANLGLQDALAAEELEESLRQLALRETGDTRSRSSECSPSLFP
jgi:16S rRNA G966 N2-methylase RsmD